MHCAYRGGGDAEDVINIVEAMETAYWRQKGLLIKSYGTVFFFSENKTKKIRNLLFGMGIFLLWFKASLTAQYDMAGIYIYTRRQGRIIIYQTKIDQKVLNFFGRIRNYTRSLRQLLALENELKVSRWH